MDRVPLTQSMDQPAQAGPIAPTNRVTNVGGGDAYKFDKDYHRMADLLALSYDERMDYTTAQKVSFIRDSIKTANEDEAILKLQHYVRELGTTYRGNDLVKQLYQQMRIKDQRVAPREIEKAAVEKKVEEKKVEEVKKATEPVKEEKVQVTPPSSPSLKTRLRSEVNEALKPTVQQIRSQVKDIISRRIDRTIQYEIKSGLQNIDVAKP